MSRDTRSGSGPSGSRPNGSFHLRCRLPVREQEVCGIRVDQSQLLNNTHGHQEGRQRLYQGREAMSERWFDKSCANLSQRAAMGVCKTPVPGRNEFGFAVPQFGADSIVEQWAEPVAGANTRLPAVPSLRVRR